ncbi:unnamed protein product [Clonostachys rhizophaga]|uniref:Histone H4 n=1 Tax=Clonostachys rhizophaga TaxID=160324 RepID=A0A9N9YDU1_9HYPO|nr:unnamed protein product [Clonostachys rhizophaga]
MPVSVPSRGGPGGGKKGTASKTIPGRKSTSGKVPLGSSRHRKVVRDSIRGITRRGGVKRISGNIYEDCRKALKDHLSEILRICVMYVEYRSAKTVTVNDVIYSLRQIGRPIYGFDPEMDRKKLRSMPFQDARD